MSMAHLSASKLSDLSLHLQSHILSFLCDPQQGGPVKLSHRRPSIQLSLDAARTITEPLPKSLLPVAHASTQLSSAVADVLGRRVNYLTVTATSGALAEWVTALGPVVKAVSMRDMECKRVAYDDARSEVVRFNALCERAINLCKAMSRRNVSVQILDLGTVPFYRCKALEHDLILHLAGALRQSSATLKELSLPVTRVCTKALKRVSLKRLEVLELELREVDGNFGITEEIGRAAEAFLKILRALEQGTGSNVSSLRELRLMQVHEAPCVDVEPSGCTMALFSAVKTLRLEVIRSGNHDNDSVAMFISLFPNLGCLYWNGAVTHRHLQRINSACPKLQELHLRPYIHFEGSCRSLRAKPDDPAILLLLRASQGKLKTLVLKGLLGVEQMKLLAESCPHLQHLKIEIGISSVGGLTSLLGTHCRNIRKLELPLTSCIGHTFEAEDWRTFTDALSSASDRLIEVSIWAEDGSIPLDISIETMAQSLVDVLECLGARARVARFNLSLMRGRYPTVIDALCRILKTCATHNKGLECLEARFRISAFRYEWDSLEEERNMVARLGRERVRLLEEAPRLRSLSLGPLDWNAQKTLEMMELAPVCAR